MSFFLIAVFCFIAIIFIGFIIYKFYLLFFDKVKSKFAVAQVERIKPYFIKGYKKLEVWLEIHYTYSIKNREYHGNVKVLFNELIQDPNLVITYNEDLELPVLFFQNQVYIGSESIEHILIQIINQIPIRYLKMDPSRSFLFLGKDSKLLTKK